jgi:hypothetical protein
MYSKPVSGYFRIADHPAVDVLSGCFFTGVIACRQICHKKIALCHSLSVCPVHAQCADRRYDAFGIAS